MKVSNTSKRLKQIMKERNLRQIDLLEMVLPFCREYDVRMNRSDISQYVSGKNEPGQEKLTVFSMALGVSEPWLMGYDDPPTTASLPASVRRISDQSAQRIPMIGEIAAGIPIVAEQDYETFVDCPMKADFALTVRGDSMEPTFLDGDVVYLREQPDVDEGQIAAVIVDDSATLKHVYHDPNGLTLISENRSYPPMHYTSENSESLRILGLVVGYTRMFKPSPLKGVSKGMPKK